MSRSVKLDTETLRERQARVQEPGPPKCQPVTPMWEAMDCPDVTDDPFYDFD